MADVRTLKLNLLADVSDFNRGIAKADDDTNKFQKNLANKSKKMAKSIAAVTVAVGAMAIAIGIDAVKAAAEDEASQKKFQETLKNTAGVVDSTVLASINNYIERMQFASGFSDGELRDSLGRLTTSTGNVTEAQDLQNLAMDISRGTGKDLAGVSEALARAYDGNEGALKRLGIPLDEAILKSGDFKDITDELSRLFGGQASTYADTYQGKLDIVNQRLGELKESAGAPLLGTLSTLLEKVTDVSKGFGGEDPQSLSNRARELAGNFEGDGAYSLGGALRGLTDAFEGLFTIVTEDGDKSASSMQTIANALESVANGINAVSSAYSKARDVGGKVLDLLTIDPGEGPKFAESAIGKAVTKKKKSRAAGGSVMSGGAYRVGEFGPELFIPNGSGSIRPDTGNGGVTIIMNGVIDGESARRSIERLLQNSSRRTGAVNLVGATL
jgi:hypothetical protein